MQNHPQLLRRPLPPKPPKLPLYKKVRTASKLPQDESEGDTTGFSDSVSRKQLQTPVSIRNLSLDFHVQTTVTTVSISLKSSKKHYWRIPETATGFIFFPSCHSASSRVFRKEAKQTERSRKPKEETLTIKRTPADKRLILSCKPTSAPSPVIAPEPKEVRLEYLHLSKSRTSTFKQPLMDVSATRPSPLPRMMAAQAKSQRSSHLEQNTAAVLNVTQFPGGTFIPAPILPRKPHRQSAIETQVTESENLEGVPRESAPAPQEGHIKSRKVSEKEVKVMHSEGYKTVRTIQYETVKAMTNLAVVNCQIHGRNALNLKGFFILNCPDLTPLAFQLIYLNLSFNDISSFPTEVFCLKNLQVLILRNNPIKEIPAGIQQLKYLRIFNIAFNFIGNLPLGLFSLPYLEELNISYNNIAFIPNEIQNLRSLKKLIADGNDLTSFPPGILKLNLKNIEFKNNYTSPCLWKENSLNSPQRLTQLTALFFLKNNLHKYYDAIPVKIQTLLSCTSGCEWCGGPRFGGGYRVIQSCNVFGVARLPVLFHVCSAACYRGVNESSVF